MSQSTISARIDTEDKKAFDNFCESVGLNTSCVLNMFIKKVIAEERIPFEITSIKSQQDDDRYVIMEEGLKAFYELREEAQKYGLQDMTLDEINSEIKAVREGK